MGTFAGGVGLASSSTANGALGVVAGFLAGGLVAEHLSRDHRYDFLTYDMEQKKNIIGTLLTQSGSREGADKAK